MFEDLVPSAPAQTPAPPPGLFDDLIPAGGANGGRAGGLFAAPGRADEQALPRSTADTDPGDRIIEASQRNGQLAAGPAGQPADRDATSAQTGLFDDLIPKAARTGAAAGGAVGGMSNETEPSVGSVLKQLAIGVPEGAMNMAGLAADAMSLRPVEHAIISALFGESTADALAPNHSKLLHEALPDVANPQNYPAHNLAERIARGVGEALPGAAIPGGSIWARLLTQAAAGGIGALAAEAVPESYKEAAQFAGNLVGASIPALRSAIFGAMKKLGVPPERLNPADIEGTASGEIRPPNDRPPGESGTGTTGPPPDQGQLPQNGAPSGAVSIFGGPVEQIPSHRLAGKPPKPGDPPIGDDGYPIELHHHGQMPDGPISELTRNDHRIGENYKLNHPNTGGNASLIDRVLFRSQRSDYWLEQWRSGRFDNLPELSETQIAELRRNSKVRMKSQERRSDE